MKLSLCANVHCIHSAKLSNDLKKFNTINHFAVPTALRTHSLKTLNEHETLNDKAVEHVYKKKSVRRSKTDYSM